MKYELDTTHITFYETKQYQTISDFLTFWKQNKKNQYLLLTNQQILLNGIPVTQKQQLVQEGTITVLFDKQAIDWPLANKEATVLYKDDLFLVVHKDAGYIIHDTNDINCLNSRVARYLYNHHIYTPVRPLHRLDKDTTGLVLYCLIPFFQPFLDAQMESKQIHRTYEAIVYGNLAVGKRFTINAPIAKDRHHNNQYIIYKTGKPSKTHCKVIHSKDGYNLIECILDTGRTHQIRVHLSSKNLPIVNDLLYGKSSKDFTKMGLHAKKISFQHPLTHQNCVIQDYQYPDASFFSF